jgi:hypothetical protein
MSVIDGTWDVTLKTPIGALAIVYTFDYTADALTGTGKHKGETVPLTDITCADDGDEQHVTWRQSLTEPKGLNLKFDVTILDDALTGQFRAGRLFRSNVTGVRRNT